MIGENEVPVRVWSPDLEDEPPPGMFANFTPTYLRTYGWRFNGADGNPEYAARFYALELNAIQPYSPFVNPGSEHRVRVRTESGKLFEFEMEVRWGPYDLVKKVEEVFDGR